jgi:TPR repeat protein
MEVILAQFDDPVESKGVIRALVHLSDGGRDNLTAMHISKPIADRGDANAQDILGIAYGNGEGLPKDDILAAKCFRKAADQGYADAPTNLGVAYSFGHGVPMDCVLASMNSVEPA